MSPTNSQALAERLDDIASTAAPASGQPTVRDLLLRQQAEIARALPKHLDIDRFMRLVLTECRTNPKLFECTFESLMSAVMSSAQLGLEPGPLGHAYLIPRYSSKRRVTECSFQIGYTGYIELFRRAGVTVVARKVCANDEWSYWTDEHGDHLRHSPADGDRGPALRYYGLASLPGGQRIVHVMSMGEINDRRKRSQKPDSGPWDTDFDSMAAKTVVRAMARWVPKSVTLEDAIATERDYADAPALMVPPDSVQPAVAMYDAPAIEGDDPEYGYGQDDEWEDPDQVVPGEEKESLL